MARRSRRDTRRTSPHDTYLDVRVSKLRHRNRSFIEGGRIYEKASSVHSFFRSLHWGQATLRFALSKATEENTPLSADLVGNILDLNELMATAATYDDAARWIHDNMTEPSKVPNRRKEATPSGGAFKRPERQKTRYHVGDVGQ